MVTYLRYALAFICFAASVACLALWVHTVANERRYSAAYSSTLTNDIRLMVVAGTVCAERSRISPDPIRLGKWRFQSAQYRNLAWQFLISPGEEQSLFGHTRTGIFFPLWYASLVFALAGVGVLRFRRQFSVRSALIAFAVVAALLAMPLTL
ncbi:MAG: hypothetical protein JNL18_03985 [Planctomycetaceae bacterium]|nr:hypothetical protein [Planctomycetaceae bacterium]